MTSTEMAKETIVDETMVTEATEDGLLDDVNESNEIDIQTKKIRFSETYGVQDENDLISIQKRLKEKFFDVTLDIKSASLAFKITMEANPTPAIPAKITSFSETYKIENEKDIDAFIESAKDKLDSGIVLKTGSVAFKMNIKSS